MAGGLLAAACSGAGHGAAEASPGSKPAEEAATPAREEPSPSRFVAEPDRVPKTEEEALRLVRAVVFTPRDWGPEFVAQDPAESGPRSWAVLDATCHWRREPSPDGVLATLSRYSELPGAADRGTVRLTAVVTVHRTVAGADRQVNTTLEEAMRCPDQWVRPGERITDLVSAGSPWGTGAQTYADDSVYESGRYVSQSADGETRHPYEWVVNRIGTVVVAVSVKGGAGHTPEELAELATQGTSGMRSSLVALLGEDA